MARSLYQCAPDLILPEFALSDLALAEEVHEGGLDADAKALEESYLKLRASFLSGDIIDAEDTESLRKQNNELYSRFLCDLAALDLYEDMLEVVLERFEPEEALPSDEELTERFMDRMGRAVRVERAFVWGMLSCLPVRLTRERFYQTLMERLSVFKGGDPDAFRDKISALCEQAGFLDDASEDPYMEDLKAIERVLREKKPEEFTREEAEALSRKVEALQETIRRQMDCFSLLEDSLNALMAAALCTSGGVPLNELLNTENDAYRLLQENSKLYRADSEEAFSESEQAAMQLSEMLEGKPEEALERFDRQYQELERKYSGKKHVWNEEEEKELRFGRLMNKIYSGSRYADLEALTSLEDSEKEPVPDPEWENSCTQLIREFQEVFSGSSRFYRRSVMASVLKELPPALSSAEEIENLFYNALSSCREPAEKRVAIRHVFKLAEDL